MPVSFLSTAPALIEIAKDLNTTPETMNLAFSILVAMIFSGIAALLIVYLIIFERKNLDFKNNL